MGHDSRKALTDSRAFLFGESVFTTLRVEKGRVYFAEAHQRRLFKSAEFLWPGTLSQAERLWKSLTPPGDNGVWRITLSCQQVGRDLRLAKTPELMLDEVWTPELPVPQSWRVRSVASPARASDWPTFLKSGDYLSRLVAARHLPADEIPLFHVAGKVCEYLHANVFLFLKGEIVTPALNPNVLDGVGRQRFIEMLKQNHLRFSEREVSVEELSQATALCAVNAVRGISQVSSIDSRSLQGHAIFEKLAQDFFI